MEWVVNVGRWEVSAGKVEHGPKPRMGVRSMFQGGIRELCARNKSVRKKHAKEGMC